MRVAAEPPTGQAVDTDVVGHRQTGVEDGVAVDDPGIAAVSQLGNGLHWHRAISADVVLSPDGPVVIDVNPRLVEPANAAASGVDLVGPDAWASLLHGAPQVRFDRR